jgi:hypothetical protein
MKKSLKFVFLFVILAIQGCDLIDFNEDCGECFTPPKNFVFELLDKNTHENVFTNGSYDAADIEIISLEDNSAIQYDFIGEDSINVIDLYSVGWQTEIVNYAICIANDTIFEFYANASRVSEDCCSFTRWNEVRIDRAEYELSSVTGWYEIVVD